MLTHTIATPVPVLDGGAASDLNASQTSILVKHEKQEASVFFDKKGTYTHSSAVLSQPLSAKQMVKALPGAFGCGQLVIASVKKVLDSWTKSDVTTMIIIFRNSNQSQGMVKKALSACVTAAKKEVGHFDEWLEEYQAASALEAEKTATATATTVTPLAAAPSTTSASSSNSSTSDADDDSTDAASDIDVELLLPEQADGDLTVDELAKHLKATGGFALADQDPDGLDVLEDEGGGREETKLQCGDLVWLFAQPDETLPALPTAVVAETAAAAALQNLPQQLVALHACAKCHAPAPAKAAGDPAKKTPEAICTCGVTAGTTIGDYPGLSATPMLMNHLWVQQQPFSYADPKGTGIFCRQPSFIKGQRYDNIPLPSIAMPLEGKVCDISNGDIKVQVTLPKVVAEKWFRVAENAPDSYTSFAKPLKLTPALVNARVAAALAAPGASASDIGHHAGAMAACLTLGKHHVAASTRYPLHASNQTKYDNFLHFVIFFRFFLHVLLVLSPQLVSSYVWQHPHASAFHQCPQQALQRNLRHLHRPRLPQARRHARRSPPLLGPLAPSQGTRSHRRATWE
jgi:hypothetical protein